MKMVKAICALILKPFHWLWKHLVNLVGKTLVILPGAALAVTCIIFDRLLYLPAINTNNYARAITDSFGHAIIAVVGWFIVAGINKEGIVQALFCGVMSSAIDVDHFIMARSFHLKDALSLPHRPPLHCTTIIPLLVPILQTWCARNIPCLHMLPYIFTVSMLSHHLRDAQRRGLWFWPIGSTPPLPYWVYIVSIITLPYLVKDVMQMIDRLPSDSFLSEPSPMTV